jgi:tRNA pseudouridine55 synthase
VTPLMPASDEIRLYEDSLLLVDKPSGWTSFDVVHKIRKTFRLKKVGHAGTLDPLATGLLIVCSGKRLKQMQDLIGLDKEYEGALELGIRTPSYDTETEVSERHSTEGISPDAVTAAMRTLEGSQLQIPPMWSAVKVHGKPLYRYAHAGRTVERTARPVHVAEFVPLNIALPRVTFRVTCSKGTYIRTLVDDLGVRLGCGACLTSLRRTRIGPYHVTDAVPLVDMVSAREHPVTVPA